MVQEVVNLRTVTRDSELIGKTLMRDVNCQTTLNGHLKVREKKKVKKKRMNVKFSREIVLNCPLLPVICSQSAEVPHAATGQVAVWLRPNQDSYFRGLYVLHSLSS